MADLDIAETRLPQDGRIELTVGGRPVDLRVSTLPTMYGESTVMRVLDRSVVALSLDNLGFYESERKQIQALLLAWSTPAYNPRRAFVVFGATVGF